MPYEALRIDSMTHCVYCATSLDMKAKQVYNNTEANKVKGFDMTITRCDIECYQIIQKEMVARARNILKIWCPGMQPKLDYIDILFSRNNKTVIINCASCPAVHVLKMPLDVFIGDYKKNLHKIKKIRKETER